MAGGSGSARAHDCSPQPQELSHPTCGTLLPGLAAVCPARCSRCSCQSAATSSRWITLAAVPSNSGWPLRRHQALSSSASCWVAGNVGAGIEDWCGCDGLERATCEFASGNVGLASGPQLQFTRHQSAERTCLVPDSQGLVPLTPLAGTGLLMPCSNEGTTASVLHKRRREGAEWV